MACLMSLLLPRVQGATPIETIYPLVNQNTFMRRPSTSRYTHHHLPLRLTLVMLFPSLSPPLRLWVLLMTIRLHLQVLSTFLSQSCYLMRDHQSLLISKISTPLTLPTVLQNPMQIQARRKLPQVSGTPSKWSIPAILTPRNRSPGPAMEKPRLVLAPAPSRGPNLVIVPCPDPILPPVHLERRSLWYPLPMPWCLHQNRFLLLHLLLLLPVLIRCTSLLLRRYAKTSPRHLRLPSLQPVLLLPRTRRTNPPSLSTLLLVPQVLGQAVTAKVYRWTSLGSERYSVQTETNPPPMACGPVSHLRARLLARRRRKRRRHRRRLQAPTTLRMLS